MTPEMFLPLSPFLLSGALTFAIGVYCLKKKEVAGAQVYGVSALAKAAMIAGFVAETVSGDLATKVFWDHLQYLPMFLSPLALLVFVHQFTGRPFRVLPWKGVLLGAFPAVFLTWTFTGAESAWISTGHHLVQGNHYSVLTYSFGPLLVAAAGYIYVLIAYSLLVLFAEYRRVPRHFRAHIRVVSLGVMIPVAGSVFTLLEWSPLLHRDLAPVTFGLSSGVVAWGLFRHKLFRRSLIEFEQIWHDLTEGIIVIDRDGTVMAINPAATALLDQAPRLELGEPLPPALEKSYPQLHATLVDHLESGRPVVGEFTAASRFLQFGVRSLSTPSGGPLGAVVQIHDETREKVLQERLQARASTSESTARDAEARLHENQEQLEMALVGAELGTWDWRVQTGEVTFNRRWTELVGLEECGVEPHIDSWKKLIHPDDRDRVHEALQAHLEGRTPMYEVEHRLRHRSGSWIWVLSRGKVIARDASGSAVRACGTHLDVTARKEALALQKELGEKLQRAERMESLGLLAGGVAHDLNNLLAPVVGYSQMLLRDLHDRPDFAKRAQRIERAGKDAAELVQDLLALARRGRYEMKPVDMSRLIADLLESPGVEKLRQSQPAVTVARKFSLTPAMVSGSEVHLKKAFLNLVVNAFDAMSHTDAGTLSVSVEKTELHQLEGGFSQLKPGSYVRVGVRDTGQGIAPEDRHRIFEPYFSKKTMTGSSGSGLGLSVVYGVLKDHGGYYDLLSEVGRGTEFVLYFPASEVPSEIKPSEIDVPRGSESVLVVDDSEEQRDLAREMIESLGYQVSAVENGYEAAAFLEAKKVDIVVLDMILADSIDGLDTFRRLRKIRPRQKALLVSGFSATERVAEACRLGAGGFVNKPYTLAVIGQALRRELDRKAPLAPDHAPAAPPVVL